MLTGGECSSCTVTGYEDGRGEKGVGEEVHVLQVGQLVGCREGGMRRAIVWKPVTSGVQLCLTNKKVELIG